MWLSGDSLVNQAAPEKCDRAFARFSGTYGAVASNRSTLKVDPADLSHISTHRRKASDGDPRPCPRSAGAGALLASVTVSALIRGTDQIRAETFFTGPVTPLDLTAAVTTNINQSP